MMSRMLGAPLWGTTRGGHHGLEFTALSLITPPNGIGCGGSCFPSSVIVELGEPGVPLICWAEALVAPKPATISTAIRVRSGVAFLGRSFIFLVTRLEIGLLMAQCCRQVGHLIRITLEVARRDSKRHSRRMMAETRCWCCCKSSRLCR